MNGEAVVLAEDGRVSASGKPWLAGSSLRLDQAVIQHREVRRSVAANRLGDGLDAASRVSRPATSRSS